MPQFILDLANLVNSPVLQERLFPLQIILGGIGLFLLGFFIYLYFRTPWFELNYGAKAREFLSFKPFGLRSRVREWKRIQKRFEKGQRDEALEEAQSMLKEVLTRLGFEGESLEAQIALVPEGVFHHTDQLLSAIHLTAPTSEGEGRKALEAYETALSELDIL